MTRPPDTSVDRDERLARVLEDALRRQAAGEALDVDALARAQPDLADELRQLLAVGQFVNGLARSAGGSSRTCAHPGPPAATGALPRAFGDYELVEELGRGGMGVVYRARDRALGREVALKMILRGQHATAADLERFRSEAQAAAGLAHPNIVPVYQVGAHDGQAYFSMKYVPARTLADVVKAGPLPQRRAAGYAAAVARAVQHAHEKGILHRDLKPANVLIDEADQPLVTDFGLAKRVAGGASLTGTGAILGTPSYMPPEQAEGGPVGPAGDVYSLGAILYELLTGRPPFLAASAVDTILLVRTEEPVRPRLLNPQLDPDLEYVCRKCLEKRPEHRYAHAAALADDLDAYLQGEPVSARSGSFVDFVGRLLRETHHAPVLENWGLLWIWHSLMIFLLCAVTSAMYALLAVRDHAWYLALWSIGLIVWGTFFWSWRKRGGAVTFVERQIAHAWGAGVTASIGMFVVEVMLGLDALLLSPVLAIMAGMVFVMKAGTLSGWFYIPAGLMFLSAVPMALLGPAWGLVLFGGVSAVGFFFPGLKYYRQRLRSERPAL